MTEETQALSPEELESMEEWHRLADEEAAKSRTREERRYTGGNDIWDDQEAVASRSSMWSKSGPAYFPTEETTSRLFPGQYTVEYSHGRGIYFRRKPINIDKLLILPDTATEEIVEGIKKFWDKQETFQKLGFLWKRGILLYGPPGGGKTSTLQLISKKIIDKGGISIFVKDPKMTAEGLEVLRRIEPDRPIVVLLEDIDSITEKHSEHDVLAMLDGELQINNVVFIATTNYPEQLEDRIVNRPSRFDIVKQIGMPSAEARRLYLTTMSKRLREDEEELERWVAVSKDYSVAHLKEMIIAVEALDQPLQEVVARLDKMRDSKPSSADDFESDFGFTGGHSNITSSR
jgi:hypothetical protein